MTSERDILLSKTNRNFNQQCQDLSTNSRFDDLMLMTIGRNSIIIGSGSYVPEKILPNSYFNELLGEDVDTWLRQNLKIRERRW